MNWIAIQKALKLKGFDPGPADGIPGVRTHGAVISFQASVGLVTDGEVGPKTLAALGIKEPKLIEPPWLAILTAKKGLRESQDNKALRAWLKSDGKTLGDPAKNPWCGDAIETCILNAGYGPVPSNPYFARNWAKYGVHAALCYGGIGSFVRGSGGHVAAIIGRNKSGSKLRIRGGNQSNMICDVWIAANRLIDCRLPTTWTGDIQPLPVLADNGEPLSTNEA
jgi:peptidoglycan hydrolase-like protein with peptidoglycan-binding domain